ncbi:sugar-binding protein, partial [Streptomyces sp. NPDC060131]
MRNPSPTLRRSPALLGVLALLTALLSLWSQPASAAPAGQVLASPDLAAHPQGDNSYPRAVRLDHNGSAGQTMLVT